MWILMGLPVIWLILIFFPPLRTYRGWTMAGLILFNFIAIGVSGSQWWANYLWICLLMSCLIALLLVLDTINRHFDLVITRYLRQLRRWLALATTVWWLIGLLGMIVG